jgi:hypothetical protein
MGQNLGDKILAPTIKLGPNIGSQTNCAPVPQTEPGHEAVGISTALNGNWVLKTQTPQSANE